MWGNSQENVVGRGRGDVGNIMYNKDVKIRH